MTVQCRSSIFFCSKTFVLTQLLLALASAVHYDGDDPIFHEGASTSFNGEASTYPDNEHDLPSSSLMYPEPIDLTLDTRFRDAASWELKINKDISHPLTNLQKLSGRVHRSNSKPKRIRGPSRTSCGVEANQYHEPPLSAQNLIGHTLKRSDVATTMSELKEKLNNEEILKEDLKKVKKNHPETYWACETSFRWTNLGSDYYPRHVRSASCNSSRCANGHYRCVPRTYTLQILKRFTVSDSATLVQDNNLLPPELRADWKLVNHEIIHCCECSNRLLTLGK